MAVGLRDLAVLVMDAKLGALLAADVATGLFRFPFCREPTAGTVRASAFDLPTLLSNIRANATRQQRLAQSGLRVTKGPEPWPYDDRCFLGTEVREPSLGAIREPEGP